ncbi:MAG TPA: HD domain-containing protein [Patescibacteria group bacterium]|nr:HD domain-containing protein [Patescibacteria group bacterium]
MIPSEVHIQKLWDDYRLPPYKRSHCLLVARVALWFAHQLMIKRGLSINLELLQVAALVHDIDKMAPKRKGEHHPDTGVRILRESGFGEVADLVRTHPLHAILDPTIAPKTIEQKLLYLSDKMVKHSIITVDERFTLWRKEKLPFDAVAILDAAYPKVKALEKKLCSMVGVKPHDIAKLANTSDLSTMKLL